VSPAFTYWPSRTFTSAISPSMRDLTATLAMACTVPTASSRTGVASRRAAATTTGTTGVARGCAAVWDWAEAKKSV